MKRQTVNGVELAYVERGEGDETVVLSPSYVVDHRHFEAQIEELSRTYRVVAYDHREHGSSGAAVGPYTIDDITADAAGLIEQLEAAPCHFIGLSTGGFVGLRLALRRPELLRSLVVMDSSAELEPQVKRWKYEAMFIVLRWFGFAPLLETVMSLMFAPATLKDAGRADEIQAWRERIAANDVEGLIRFGRAIFGRDSLVEQLGDITMPTLVLTGELDGPQPPKRGQRIAAGIPGAEFLEVPGAGHLATVDAPDEVTETLSRFLVRVRTAAARVDK